MMGLVLKESHRSWGFPIGVNTQHTSSASLFLQHRWVLEAPGRKVLIGECPCTQLCGWRTSMLNSSSCRPCVLLPRRKLLGLIFLFLKCDQGWLSYGRVSCFEAVSGGFVVVLCWAVFQSYLKMMTSWTIVQHYNETEAGGSAQKNWIALWTAGHSQCSQHLLCHLSSLWSSGLVAVGGKGRQKLSHMQLLCFLRHKHTALPWSKKSGDERGSKVSSHGEGCIFPFY